VSKARIMVVEDEGLVAMQIKDTLETLGYEVPAVVSSGEEAVARAGGSEPDLVLMDIRLKGGMSGTEAARRIRASLDVPIVYLSAYSDEKTLQEAEVSEPFGYVLKPFDERSLHAVIQMALIKSRRVREARQSDMWISAIPTSLSEAVVICDTKGMVKFLNPAAETLLGRTKEQVAEKRLHDILSLRDSVTREKVAIPVSEPLAEGRSIVKSYRLQTGGGEEVPVEFSASPLRSSEGTLFGILFVFRRTSEREKVQEMVLQELAGLSSLQKQNLPPRNTAIGGVRFDWAFHPRPFGGGDTLGFFPLGDNRAAFYALNVLGTGVLSSLFSMLLRTYLSPEAERGGILVNPRAKDPDRRVLTPAEVVRQLTKRFFLGGGTNPYFTLVYGIIDCGIGAGRLVRAGYPPPLLLRESGATAIKPDGYAIGLFPEAEMPMEDFRLDHGDRLVIASDGLTECTDAGGAAFMPKRLAETFRASSGKSLPEAVDAADAAVQAWRGAEPFDDDVSLLVLERP
jgi:PAS domain S-box-containing protein